MPNIKAKIVKHPPLLGRLVDHEGVGLDAHIDLAANQCGLELKFEWTFGKVRSELIGDILIDPSRA